MKSISGTLFVIAVLATVSFAAQADPLPQTERVTMRSRGFENWLRIWRPALCSSVAFARTMRNSSSGVTPSTKATPISR